MTPAEPLPDDASLFHGIAVLIDDEINDPGSGIRLIQQQIEAVGCHVVKMTELPQANGILNLRSISFCVLDWNLYATALRDPEGGGTVPGTELLKKQNEEAAVDFLTKLKNVCVAPVFILTNEEIAKVEEVLKEHKLLDENDPSHILVRSKGDVSDTGVFKILSEWMGKAPSVYVLKKWERTYERAKNEMFLDFYANSVLWPLVLWETYKEDSVDESVELGNLIGRNLLSRMTPFHFDLAPFKAAMDALKTDRTKSRAIVMKVLEGERFLSKERLQNDSIEPGDVFKKGSDYFINIRPECDCIAREGKDQNSVELYLLRGNKLSEKKLSEKANGKFGTISELDNETIIFGMTEGKTFSFYFKDQLVEKWGDWKTRRIGRLLPPFLTRLQQRYSAYLQRPGVTRIPASLLPIAIPAEVEAAPDAGKQVTELDFVKEKKLAADPGNEPDKSEPLRETAGPGV
jgi:hypothetical protein